MCKEITDARADVLITGDIAEADSLLDWLSALESELACPIYFVLGNHDYYGGSMRSVRAAVESRCRDSRYLRWLDQSGVVRLSAAASLVGAGGWADARYGDYERSGVRLNDLNYIHDLIGHDHRTRGHILASFGDEAASALASPLQEAMRQL